MSKTNISWCDEVWNPVVGCSHAGQGCDNCYARELHNRRYVAYLSGRWDDAPKQYRQGFHVVQCLPERLDAPLHWKKPRTIFVNSVSDLFHKDVPDEFIWKVMATIEESSRHTYIVLTKRPKRMAEFMHQVRPYPNIYLGMSVSTQDDLDAKIGDFLQVPGKKILSVEPLLSGVDAHLMRNPDMWVHRMARTDHYPGWKSNGGYCRISGIIVGGESGKNARPMHPDWARSLRDQCAAADVDFCFKQNGEYALMTGTVGDYTKEQLQTVQWIGSEMDIPMIRVGVKAAGRLLDGKMHDALPWAARGDE